MTPGACGRAGRLTFGPWRKESDKSTTLGVQSELTRQGLAVGGDRVRGSEPTEYTLFVAAATVAVYFIPTFIAWRGKHPSATAIFVLNLLLGWTGVGWVVALIWAFTGEARTTPPPPPALRKCTACFGEIDARATVCRYCRTSLVEEVEE